MTYRDPPRAELTRAVFTIIAMNRDTARVFIEALASDDNTRVGAHHQSRRAIATLLTIARNIEPALADLFFAHVLCARCCENMSAVTIFAPAEHRHVTIESQLMTRASPRIPRGFRVLRSRAQVFAKYDDAIAPAALRGTWSEYYAARTGWLIICDDAAADHLRLDDLGVTLARGINIAIDPRIALVASGESTPRVSDVARDDVYFAALVEYKSRGGAIVPRGAIICDGYPCVICIADGAQASRIIAQLNARAVAVGAVIADGCVCIPASARGRYESYSPFVICGPFPPGIPIMLRGSNAAARRRDLFSSRLQPWRAVVPRVPRASFFIEGEPFFTAIPYCRAPDD